MANIKTKHLEKYASLICMYHKHWSSGCWVGTFSLCDSGDMIFQENKPSSVRNYFFSILLMSSCYTYPYIPITLTQNPIPNPNPSEWVSDFRHSIYSLAKVLRFKTQPWISMWPLHTRCMQIFCPNIEYHPKYIQYLQKDFFPFLSYGIFCW